MTENWSTIDLAELLGLNQVMTPEEVSDFAQLLNKKLWSRFLNVELPKLISDADYISLTEATLNEGNLDKIIAEITKLHPEIDVKALAEKAGSSVKKEFALGYLRDILSEYKKTESTAKLVLGHKDKIIAHLLFAIEQLEKEDSDFGKAGESINLANQYIVLLNREKTAAIA